MSWTSGLTINTNFGGWTGDYFAELFIPPTDGFINSIDLNMSDLPNVTGGSLSIAIYAAEYPWDEIDEEEIADIVPGSWLGYYENNDTLGISGDNWVLGGINGLEGADSSFRYDPLGEKLWPEFGFYTLDLHPNEADQDTVTLDMENSAFGPFYFEWGQPFMVVVKVQGFEDQDDGMDYRTGFFAGVFHHTPQPCLKFYNTLANPDGRTGANDWGWHIRSYVWDWSLNVMFTGDPYYYIDLEQLPTTLNMQTRVVTARILPEHPTGDHAVVNATLHYSVSNEASQVPMEYHEGMYLGLLPAQDGGMDVAYWVTIDLANGHTLTSETLTYSIFDPDGAMLFVYDAEDMAASLAQYWYNLGFPDEFTHDMDMWEARFGPITSGLIEHYEVIYHVMGGGPVNDARLYSDVYSEWLSQGTEESPKRLAISGQDYGVISGYADTTFPADAFENHYLGIEILGPQDVTYGDPLTSTTDAYAIDAVENDPLSGFLWDYAGDSLQLYHDPYRELGFINWVDNLTPSSGTVCFTDPGFSDAATAVYNSGDGWKTAFWALDPLALSYYVPGDTSRMHHWAVEAVGNPMAPTIEWFGPRTQPSASDPQTDQLPVAFKLHHNYPNPFNPTTTIAYDLPFQASVKLHIFDVLGRKIVTLVEDVQAAGNYSITWEGVDHLGCSVSSGVYYCTLTTKTFTATNKMLLLK